MHRAPAKNRFLIAMICLAPLLGLSSGIASAAEPQKGRAAQLEVKVQKVVKLQPRPESEVLVPDFKAYFLSDGSVTISGKGSAQAGAPPQGFDFEVDLRKGIYNVIGHRDAPT